MDFKDKWIDKIDGVDDVYAEDINGIANEVIRLENEKTNTEDVLAKNNTESYTPSSDYNPATKKYVDDNISNIVIPDVNITVDNTLDSTSENPVQNKVVAEALKNKADKSDVNMVIGDINNLITNNKTNLVTAINEIAKNCENEIEIVTIIDISSGESSHTFEQMFEAHQNGKLVIITAYEMIEKIDNDGDVWEEPKIIEGAGIASFSKDEYGTDTCSAILMVGSVFYSCYIQSDFGDTWDVYKKVLENTLNKVTELTSDNTDTQYPSAKAVAEALSSKLDCKIGSPSEIDNYTDELQLYRIRVSGVNNIFRDIYYLLTMSATISGSPYRTQYKFDMDGISTRNYHKRYQIQEDGSLVEVIAWSSWQKYVLQSEMQSAMIDVAYKPEIIIDKESTEYAIFLQNDDNRNRIIRLGELTVLSIFFAGNETVNDYYAEDYALDISFDSGEIPTIIEYTNKPIWNWMGVDCVTNNGRSSFQPSANKHYDILFYKSGSNIVGKVSGYDIINENEANE